MTRFVVDAGVVLRLASEGLDGDAVLRRQAWDVAERMGWADTYTAEYVSLPMVQSDAFVTLGVDLARSLEGVVETASIDALR